MVIRVSMPRSGKQKGKMMYKKTRKTDAKKQHMYEFGRSFHTHFQLFA
jgi:hypothetical protein